MGRGTNGIVEDNQLRKSGSNPDCPALPWKRVIDRKSPRWHAGTPSVFLNVFSWAVGPHPKSRDDSRTYGSPIPPARIQKRGGKQYEPEGSASPPGFLSASVSGMADGTFYDQLPVVDEFAEVAHPQHYRPVPEDWIVAVGDVRNSTGAIEEGRYKQVNVVGASVIAGILNAVGHRSVPYVFGGDGATLCVRGRYEGAVRQALAGARRMAREEFGLRLDVGIVPVADLVQQGHTVMVGRFRLSDTIEQAIFMGGGLVQAEKWVKADANGPYEVAPDVNGSADFEGLECRWENVPSHREEIVALLVHASGPTLQDRAGIYEDVIAEMRSIYGDGEDSRPVLHGQLQMRLDPSALPTEQRVQTHDETWIQRVLYRPGVWLENALGRLLMATDWTTDATQWGNYKEDMETHTDFRKMDGTLRQVLAGTQAQRKQLEAYLQTQYERGHLIYGLDVSDAAMITCLVFQYEKEHVHFVDGADGGYAHAARDLKAREEARREG